MPRISSPARLAGLSVLVALVILAVPSSSLRGQEARIPTLDDPEKPQVRVLVLGVFHFHNPGADYAQFEGIDVLTQERQREIEAVVDRLARFRPDRIAVERPAAEREALNADYRRYRAGDFELTRNEDHQLGFRLAARLGHDAVHPVDFRMGMRIDSMLAYVDEHDPELRARIDGYIDEIVQLMNRMQREETIGANLRFLNEPDHVLRAHEPYAVQATIGAGDGYIGARGVAGWYERNLHIFANLAAVASPGDRVLLIVGGGHTPILRHLVRTHPEMELVEAVEYLR